MVIGTGSYRRERPEAHRPEPAVALSHTSDPQRAFRFGSKSFTLIELLMVITIIAILAALILAALSRAKLKTQGVGCLNNQRQMSVNARIHLDDGLKQLGLLDSLPDDHPPAPRYWICPAGARPAAGLIAWSWERMGTVDSVWTLKGEDGTELVSGSYGVNMWLRGYFALDDVGGKFGNHISDRNVRYPPLTPVFGDCILYAADPDSWNWPPRNLVNPLAVRPEMGEMCFFAIPRHGNRPRPVPTYWPTNQLLPGAINIAFYDGHGEQVKLERLWQLYWHWNYVPPTKRPGLR